MRFFIVGIIFVICCLAISSCGLAYRTPTEGMLPTIGKNDALVATPVAYWDAPIKKDYYKD